MLEAAKAFLPKIAKANESIAEMTSDELNIENAESDDEHVEMVNSNCFFFCFRLTKKYKLKLCFHSL